MEKKKYAGIFESLSKCVGFILRNVIAPDLYRGKDVSLEELENITKENASTVQQTNNALLFLNKNIIELNCSTSVYSRVLLILTIIIIILTIIMIIV